jgi:signal transduction histidine kinase
MMDSRVLLAPFRRLRWKLTFSYTFVTVAVVIALEALAFAALLLVVSYSSVPEDLARQEVALAASQARPFLQGPSVDRRELAEWLDVSFEPQVRGSAILRITLDGRNADTSVEVTPANSDVVVVIDAEGRALAANFPSLLDDQQTLPFLDPLNPEISGELLAQARAGSAAVRTLDDRTILAAHPVIGDDGDVLGVFYMRLVSLAPAVPGSTLRRGLQFMGVSALIFTAGAGVIGTFFGFLTARGLTRRLQTLSDAADAWGRGDFSAVIRDPATDEIGQLAGQLNRMADQIQGLLRTREQLATLEARNRLARDLHDSVKQEVFAATMTLGAAQALWEQDTETAREKVEEAFALARKAQQDLTALIQELRPSDLEEKGLVTALEAHVNRWSRRTGTEITFEAGAMDSLSFEVEQALYRVAQEALANVAKHSGADRVAVRLACDGNRVKLTVRDNGMGFDIAEAQGTGLGLRSMHERMAALGGDLTVDSGADGTVIRAVVPVPS